MVSRSEEKLKNLKEKIELSHPAQKIVYVAIDFTEEDRASIYPKLEAVLSENKIEEISLLFNNVGKGPFGPLIKA